MWGTSRSGGNRTTWPSIRSRPGFRPCSSLSVNKSCIPRQTPKSGLPLPVCSITASQKPLFRRAWHAFGKAPTPGSTRESELFISSGPDAICTLNPWVEKPLRIDFMLLIPRSISVIKQESFFVIKNIKAKYFSTAAIFLLKAAIKTTTNPL